MSFCDAVFLFVFVAACSFLRVFFVFFLFVIPVLLTSGSAGSINLCYAAIRAICVAARRLLMTWAPRSSRGVTRGMGLAAGVTQEMPAAQWIPAYAGMTTDGARGEQGLYYFSFS